MHISLSLSLSLSLSQKYHYLTTVAMHENQNHSDDAVIIHISAVYYYNYKKKTIFYFHFIFQSAQHRHKYTNILSFSMIIRSNRTQIDDEYVKHGGYNEVGELNNIIILYPQAIVIGTNPLGCWDWWGYTGTLYGKSDIQNS